MSDASSGRRGFLKQTALGLSSVALAGLPAGSSLSSGSSQAAAPLRVDDWVSIQAQYHLSPSRTYLNTGGLGPSPEPVLSRFRDRTTERQTMSETGHRIIEESRAPVASFFGASEEEIAFTRNATEGNAIIASGLRLKRGDEIIIDSHAHPGGAIPWLNQLNELGVVVRVFDPTGGSEGEILTRIEDLVSDRTRVIQVSHVTAPTGILLPVDDIAKLAQDRGCWFHIDGAQSAGMVPFDLHDIGCDSYATSGHKWLGAPHGTGVLYIKEERLADVVPTEVGAYSDAGFSLPDTFVLIPTARRHESGTRNAPLVAAVRSACDFMSAIGMDRVRQRGLDLVARLRDGLESIPALEILTPEKDNLHGSILTFRPLERDFQEVNRRLGSEHKLRLRIVTEVDLNAIRVSLHVFNSEDEVDRVIEGVRAVLS
ncbi:MAG: aminotransferase class V-fold PLP-dependent enzyme [Bacteroidetes bacterium]|nr:aminotransferase class V-fold PLP-dependent enzyme [Bacteroidota bacterium]